MFIKKETFRNFEFNRLIFEVGGGEASSASGNENGEENPKNNEKPEAKEPREAVEPGPDAEKREVHEEAERKKVEGDGAAKQCEVDGQKMAKACNPAVRLQAASKAYEAQEYEENTPEVDTEMAILEEAGVVDKIGAKKAFLLAELNDIQKDPDSGDFSITDEDGIGLDLVGMDATELNQYLPKNIDELITILEGGEMSQEVSDRLAILNQVQIDGKPINELFSPIELSVLAATRTVENDENFGPMIEADGGGQFELNQINVEKLRALLPPSFDQIVRILKPSEPEAAPQEEGLRNAEGETPLNQADNGRVFEKRLTNIEPQEVQERLDVLISAQINENFAHDILNEVEMLALASTRNIDPNAIDPQVGPLIQGEGGEWSPLKRMNEDELRAMLPDNVDEISESAEIDRKADLFARLIFKEIGEPYQKLAEKKGGGHRELDASSMAKDFMTNSYWREVVKNVDFTDGQTEFTPETIQALQANWPSYKGEIWIAFNMLVVKKEPIEEFYKVMEGKKKLDLDKYGIASSSAKEEVEDGIEEKESVEESPETDQKIDTFAQIIFEQVVKPYQKAVEGNGASYANWNPELLATGMKTMPFYRELMGNLEFTEGQTQFTAENIQTLRSSYPTDEAGSPTVFGQMILGKSAEELAGMGQLPLLSKQEIKNEAGEGSENKESLEERAKKITQFAKLIYDAPVDRQKTLMSTFDSTVDASTMTKEEIHITITDAIAKNPVLGEVIDAMELKDGKIDKGDVQRLHHVLPKLFGVDRLKTVDKDAVRKLGKLEIDGENMQDALTVKGLEIITMTNQIETVKGKSDILLINGTEKPLAKLTKEDIIKLLPEDLQEVYRAGNMDEFKKATTVKRAILDGGLEMKQVLEGKDPAILKRNDLDNWDKAMAYLELFATYCQRIQDGDTSAMKEGFAVVKAMLKEGKTIDEIRTADENYFTEVADGLEKSNNVTGLMALYQNPQGSKKVNPEKVVAYYDKGSEIAGEKLRTGLGVTKVENIEGNNIRYEKGGQKRDLEVNETTTGYEVQLYTVEENGERGPLLGIGKARSLGDIQTFINNPTGTLTADEIVSGDEVSDTADKGKAGDASTAGGSTGSSGSSTSGGSDDQ